jgi:7-carboxy-7-deazaguanine synthase
MSGTLKVIEIFRSIQGETSYAGLPCTFVRLAGCNLHCTWCDTRYAADEPGKEMTIEDVTTRVEGMRSLTVCITGGEPLLQPATVPLARALLKLKHIVLVETNGSLDVRVLPKEVVRVVDVKCPGSGESASFLMDNIEALQLHDEAKFVIADREDFDWAAAFVRQHGLMMRCHVLFSAAASSDTVSPRELAEWILQSGLEIRLQLQLHKLLWPEKMRGV